jgi:hypothetical protein
MAAEHAERRMLHALDEQRERRRPRAGKLDLDVLPQAAAEAPGTSRIRRELLFPDAKR